MASGFQVDEGKKFAAQCGVLEENATHHAVDHLGLGILYATPVHAEVIGLHDNGETVGTDRITSYNVCYTKLLRKMVNSVMRGVFLKDAALRREFLSLINLKP